MAWLVGQGLGKKKIGRLRLRMSEEKVCERTYRNRHTAGWSWGLT